MNEIKALETLQAAGFSGGFVDTKDFVYDPETRKFCEENKCGNFNRNYACPPYCGTVDEMKAKCDRYQRALVLKKDYTGVDPMNGPAMKPIKKQFNIECRKLFGEIKRAEGYTSENTMMILAGPCSLCDSCKMPNEEPCPMPQERASCLSAYSILVNDLANSAGITCEWTLDKASFFSLLLF